MNLLNRAAFGSFQLKLFIFCFPFAKYKHQKDFLLLPISLSEPKNNERGNHISFAKEIYNTKIFHFILLLLLDLNTKDLSSISLFKYINPKLFLFLCFLNIKISKDFTFIFFLLLFWVINIKMSKRLSP